MLHLGWVPVALQTSNPPRRGLMKLLHIHKQRTNKTKRKHSLPWAFNCTKHVNQSAATCLNFMWLTNVLLAALDNISLTGLLCTGLHPGLAGLPFILFQQCENVCAHTSERDTKNNESSVSGLLSYPCWVSGVIESGLWLPSEEGVSVLSHIVYRVIKSLYTNTCQLCSTLTKTVYLLPPSAPAAYP